MPTPRESSPKGIERVQPAGPPKKLTWWARARLTRWPKRTPTAYDRRVGRENRSVALLTLAVTALLAGGGSGTIWARDAEPELTLERVLPSSVQVVLEQQEGRRFRSGSGVVIAARSAAEGPDCFI